MGVPVFIGDEVTAAGYRLAGLRIHVPAAGEVGEALQQARESAPLVVMTAEAAAELEPGALRAAVAAPWPLLVLVPDARGRVPATDLAAELRRELGMEQ